MSYIDGFVAAVPNANRRSFDEYARVTQRVFRDCGALEVVDAWGDDVPEGKVTSFPLAVKRQPDETVVFGWIVWPSKAVRDAGMKQAMDDPRMKPDAMQMPFDGMRMIFGGFELVAKS